MTGQPEGPPGAPEWFKHAIRVGNREEPLRAGSLPPRLDALLDVVAAVGAYRRGDARGMGVVLSNADPGVALMVAVQLLAEAAEECGTGMEAFRRWSMKVTLGD